MYPYNLCTCRLPLLNTSTVSLEILAIDSLELCVGAHHLAQTSRNFPRYPINGNRWSENQSINRYRSIKLVNWYRSIDDQSITTQKSFIDWHRLAQDLKTDVTHYLSDHPRFLGSPRDEIGKTIPILSSQGKEYPPLQVYSNYPLTRHCLSVS